jgi:hypothetical protein
MLENMTKNQALEKYIFEGHNTNSSMKFESNSNANAQTPPALACA